MKVPEGQTIWIKSRKFVAGEELPGGVYIDTEKPAIKKPVKESSYSGDSE